MFPFTIVITVHSFAAVQLVTVVIPFVFVTAVIPFVFVTVAVGRARTRRGVLLGVGPVPLGPVPLQHAVYLGVRLVVVVGVEQAALAAVGAALGAAARVLGAAPQARAGLLADGRFGYLG